MCVAWSGIIVIFISAIIYNLAFYYPPLAFLILLFWVPLYGNYGFKKGFLWGILAYGIHSYWLFILLKTKSEASPTLCLFLYFFIVIYFALTSGVWFFVLQKLNIRSVATYLLIMGGYFIGLHWYGLWFISWDNIKFNAAGYPFFFPLIPLIKYKLFLYLISCAVGMFNPYKDTRPPGIKFVHLKPDDNQYRQNADIVGQRIYHKLAELNLREGDIVVAPESTYPFSLNKHVKDIDLWEYALKENSLLIGGLQTKLKKRHQSIYWIRRRRIMEVYDKTNLIPFVEKLPNFLEKSTLLSDLFLNNKRSIHEGNGGTLFKLNSKICIKPLVCSELFFGVKKVSDCYLVCFINDSWFTTTFRYWMQSYARLISAWINRPILYIGFYELIDIYFT